jgi:hypothetical protein
MQPGDDGRGSRWKWNEVSRLALMLLSVLALTFLLFYLAGLHVHGVSGRVGMVENLDAPKEQWRVGPASRVEVLITWEAQTLDGFARSSSRCVRAVITRTDEKGEFKVAGRWLAPTWPPLSGGFAASHAVKPGYYATWDYREIAPELGYTTVLGPAPLNPWTGKPLEGDDGTDSMRWGRCPEAERL